MPENAWMGYNELIFATLKVPAFDLLLMLYGA
jgi:hypothetical protein